MAIDRDFVIWINDMNSTGRVFHQRPIGRGGGGSESHSPWWGSRDARLSRKLRKQKRIRKNDRRPITKLSKLQHVFSVHITSVTYVQDKMTNFQFLAGHLELLETPLLSGEL